jgi:hypothetical protein
MHRVLPMTRQVRRLWREAVTSCAAAVLLAVSGMAFGEAVGAEWPGRQEAAELHVSARLFSVSYCGSDPVAEPVCLTLAVEARNVSPDNVILARHPAAGLPIVAESAEAGDAGVIEQAWESGDVFGTGRDLFPGARPDPESFVVVRPGESYQTMVNTCAIVGRTGAQKDVGGMREGHPYVLKTYLDWASPYYETTDAEAERDRDRWRGFGRLILEISRIGWIPFDVPPAPKPACEHGKDPAALPPPESQMR